MVRYRPPDVIESAPGVGGDLGQTIPCAAPQPGHDATRACYSPVTAPKRRRNRPDALVLESSARAPRPPAIVLDTRSQPGRAELARGGAARTSPSRGDRRDNRWLEKRANRLGSRRPRH